MRTIRKKDMYGVMQHWIMTVKDHSTGLVYLSVLPRKTAVFLAVKLRNTPALWGILTFSIQVCKILS
jgi:hypothetical protein